MGVRVRHRWRIGASYGTIVAILAAGLLLYRLDVDRPLWLQEVRLASITALGALLIGIPALCGVLLARYRLRDLDDLASQPSVKAIVDSLADLRAFLFIAGAAIVLATIGTGTGQRALVPEFVAEIEFSQDAVLAYVALLSGLLLVVYVPAHLAARASARRARDHWFDLGNMPEPTSESFSSWFERRAKLERLLELDARLAQDLQETLVILGPLLSSLLSVRLGTP